MKKKENIIDEVEKIKMELDKMKEKSKNFKLQVVEAYTRDVGLGVARIDYDSMDILNVSTGDILEIKGKRKTAAKCLPLYPSDEGKGMIRIDGLTRNNSMVSAGESIAVKKIKAVAAEKVVVAPLGTLPPIDERYLADALESVPVVKGDNVMVPYFGGRLTFQVTGVTPDAEAVLITQRTIFYIDNVLKNQKEKEIDETIKKINERIKEYEIKIIKLVNSNVLKHEEISKTHKMLDELNSLKRYFENK